MNDANTRLGLDCRGDLLYAARVTPDGGRPQIKALLRLPTGRELDHDLLKDARRILSIPENLITTRIHNLVDDEQIPIQKRALFEVSTALPGELEDFLIDLVETPVKRNQLSFVARRKLIIDYSLSVLGNGGDLQFKTRALAMCNGYLNFASLTPGELICMADATDRIVSACLIYRKKMVAMFGIDMGGKNVDDDATWKRIIAEFNTLLNHRLEILFTQGITVPLASIIVTGHFAREDCQDILRRKLSVEIGRPQINRGFFVDPDSVDQVPVEDYIVALGLTVD